MLLGGAVGLGREAGRDRERPGGGRGRGCAQRPARDPAGPRAPVCRAALPQAFGLLGKRWNGVIIGSLMEGPAGFSEIRRALGGISDSVLSERLSELVAADLLIREVD